MGYFDTVVFTCPNCTRRMEIQSKAENNPSLATYRSSDVPVVIALDLEDQIIGCEHCSSEYKIVNGTIPKRVRLGLEHYFGEESSE